MRGLTTWLTAALLTTGGLALAGCAVPANNTHADAAGPGGKHYDDPDIGSMFSGNGAGGTGESSGNQSDPGLNGHQGTVAGGGR